MDTEVSSFVESEGVREHIRDEGEERGLGKPGTRKLVSRELAPVSSLQGCGRGEEKRTENKNNREREKIGTHLLTCHAPLPAATSDRCLRAVGRMRIVAEKC